MEGGIQNICIAVIYRVTYIRNTFIGVIGFDYSRFSFLAKGSICNVCNPTLSHLLWKMHNVFITEMSDSLFKLFFTNKMR